MSKETTKYQFMDEQTILYNIHEIILEFIDAELETVDDNDGYLVLPEKIRNLLIINAALTNRIKKIYKIETD